MHETIIYIIYLFIYIQLPYCHFRPDKILFTLRCMLIFCFYFSQWIKQKIMGINNTLLWYFPNHQGQEKEIKTFPTTRKYKSCEYWKSYIMLLIIVLKSWIFYICYRSGLTNGISVMMEIILYLYILIPILLLNIWNGTSATERVDLIM